MKYIFLTLSNILIIILIIFSLFNRNKLKIIDKKIKKNILDFLVSPFYLITENNQKYLFKYFNSKIKVSMRNLFRQEDYTENVILFYSKKLSLIYFISIFFLILISLINEIALFYCFITFLLVLNYYLNYIEIKKYDNYKNLVKEDLPNFLTRLRLLLEAGINLRLSIKYIISKSRGSLIDEFIYANQLINNGKSEAFSYNEIIIYTDDLLIRKFISSIMQNLEKGGDDLIYSLELINKESIEFRKSQILIKTQESNRKLLIPNLLVFLGIMIIVMVPILFSAF